MKLLAVVPLRADGWVRWTARSLGLLVALFVLAWDIGGVVAIVTEHPWDPLEFLEGIVLLCVAATMVLAWRWEKLGGLLCMLTGVAIGIVILLTVEPERKIYLLLVVSLPPIVIGGAFLVADRGLRVLRRKAQE